MYIPICHTAFSFPQSCSSCLFHIISFHSPSRTAHRCPPSPLGGSVAAYFDVQLFALDLRERPAASLGITKCIGRSFLKWALHGTAELSFKRPQSSSWPLAQQDLSPTSAWDALKAAKALVTSRHIAHSIIFIQNLEMSCWLPWQPFTVMTRSRRLIPIPSRSWNVQKAQIMQVTDAAAYKKPRHVRP